MPKPLIAIGTDVKRNSKGRERAFTFLSYIEALRRAGAIPVLIPPQPDDLAELLERVDGLLLAGGADCDPSIYGEEIHPKAVLMDGRRQSNDLALAKLASERGIPTLGICLGLQVMNLSRGGSLIQHLEPNGSGAIDHASEPTERSRHDVEVFPGTRLASIIGSGHKNVNSSHHQAIRNVGEGLRVSAKAVDGIIEGAEDPNHRFFVGVQWHPEDMAGEETAVELFRAFVEEAGRFAERSGK